jgi:hypothetical protein
MSSLFSCNTCKNAELTSGIQTGCSLNLSNSLKILGMTDGYYDLGRVCLSKNSKPEIGLGYLFILKEEKYIDELYKNIESIKDKNPLWIGVSSDISGQIDNIATKIKSLVSCKFNIVETYESLVDDFSRLDQFAKNYKNGWTLVNVAGESFKSDAKEILQKYIIDDLKVAGLVKDEADESINNYCFFNIIYSFLKGSNPKIEEDGTIILKNFLEKIEEAQPSMIKNWGDLI